jgi:photosystem II stability/assembly factor-like uncharacterized protein
VKKIFAIVLFVLISTNALHSQFNWQWSHPKPQGNTLRYVKAFSATDWIAVGYGGTFMKTTNAGLNWYITHDAAGVQTTTQISLYNAHFFNMNTGLVCGESGRIWRTTSGGTTWDSIASGTSSLLYGMHFIDANTGFACGSSGAFIKTTDAGLTWAVVATGVTYTLYNVFALNANNLYVATGTAAILLTSTDGGTNWIKDTTGASTTLYDVAFKDANTGVVSGSSTNIRYTTDAGVTWTPSGSTLSSSTFYSTSYSGGLFYVAGNTSKVYFSSTGATWDSTTFVGNQYYISTMYCFDRNASTMITGGAFGLLNTTTNTGTNWVAQNNLLYSSTLNDIWCNTMNGTVIAVGSVAPTAVFYSSNGGANWINTVGANLGSFTVYGLKMVNSSTGYMTGSSGKVFKTTNGGLDWDSVTYAGVTSILYCPDFIDANTGWVCGASGVIRKTTDGGATWNTQTSGVTTTLYRIDMADANTGWVCGSSGVVRKTTDGGTTWNAQTPNSGATLYWIQMQNATSGYLCGSTGHVRRTTNGGTNWDTVATPYSATHYSVSFTDMNTGFVVGGVGYTMRTSNGGASWQVKNNGAVTHGAVYTKGYDSAWACVSGGVVMKLYNSLVGGITWNNEIPVNYSLSQNYPNPFNPNTTIKFGLPKAGKVILKIYDIVGQEVEALINGVELNAGTVTYDFDGSHLASGVYFYSLIVDDNKIDTKKMVMVK